MNRRLYLSVVTVLVILCGCSQNPVDTPNPIETPKPVETPNGPALGDSPTITGNISNLSDANLGGTSLKVKAELIGSEPGTGVIAEGNVAANGDFSIELPGIATLEDNLYERDYGADCPYDTITAKPRKNRDVHLQLALYSNNQRVDQLYYANGPLQGGQNEVVYTFSDRDISIKGTCAWGKFSTSFDLDMKKGWNTVILGRFPDGERSGLRTAVPDSSFKWQIPECFACPTAVSTRH